MFRRPRLIQLELIGWCIVAIVVGKSSYGDHSDWAEGSAERSTGASRDNYNSAGALKWNHFMGDWRDATDAAQGPKPFATASVNSEGQKTKPIAWDATRIVQQWRQGKSRNQGFFLRQITGNGTFVFHSREHSAASQAPQNAFLPIAIAGDFGEQPLQGAADRNKQANQSKGTSKPNDANGKPTWIAAMRKVHSRFKGDPGVLALFGDSITISRAFWFGLPYTRKNAPPAMEADFRLVKQRMLKDCWDRKGPQFGNQGRMTIRWAHENVDSWLKKLNPEVALIMFGTNDLHQLKLDEYDKKMREVVKKCLDNGTVVILSTIPPRHGYAEKSAEFADTVRKIARDMRVPLTDYHAEILRRRPDDWDGKLDKFSDYQGFDVPTLIARDGVHPSNPKKYRSDYSAEGLEHNGFVLRNYLALTKYAEVIRQTLRSGQ